MPRSETPLASLAEPAENLVLMDQATRLAEPSADRRLADAVRALAIDAIETATALVEEAGAEDGYAGAGIVVTGSVVTAGAARTAFGRDPA